MARRGLGSIPVVGGNLIQIRIGQHLDAGTVQAHHLTAADLGRLAQLVAAINLHHAFGHHGLGASAAFGEAAGLEQAVKGDEFATQGKGDLLQGHGGGAIQGCQGDGRGHKRGFTVHNLGIVDHAVFRYGAIRVPDLYFVP